MVRHTVNRAMAMHAHKMYKERIDESEEWIGEKMNKSDPSKIADYAPKNRWAYEQFNPKQVLVVDGEKLIKDPLLTQQKCERFLGLTPTFDRELFVFRQQVFYCMYPQTQNVKNLTNAPIDSRVDLATGCFDSSKGRQHPVMTESVRQMFVKIHENISEDLFKLIGERFNWDGF